MHAFIQSLNFSCIPQAAIHGVRFNNQELRLAWHKPAASLNTADPDEVEPEDEEVGLSFTVDFKLNWSALFKLFVLLLLGMQDILSVCIRIS